MFGSSALQIRLSLSAVERGVDLAVKLVIARRPDEPMTHVALRVLAYCLFYSDELGSNLRFARGPADRDGPDLWAHDLAGRPIEWIVCGEPDAEELRHVLKHQRQASVRVLFGSAEETERFFQHVRSLRRHIIDLDGVDFRQVDTQLLDRLAECDLERQRWAVTLVGDHIYVEVEGITADSEVIRLRADANTGAR